MGITDIPWSGAASKYDDTDCRACLIDLNKTGVNKTQDNCKLPIKEPNGDINKNALSAAAAALAGARGGVQAPTNIKKKAASALCRAYQEAKMDAPDSLKKLAK